MSQNNQGEGLLARIATHLIAYARQRPYYHLRRDNGDMYMERFWLMPRFLLAEVDHPRHGRYLDKRWSWLPSVRIHHICSSDLDRHKHDHPGWSISWLLPLAHIVNRYLEITPRWQGQPAELDSVDGWQWRHMRRGGDLVFRRATDRHRIEIAPGETCWSLFIMGPSKRVWCFHTEHGLVPHYQYFSAHAHPIE